MSFLIPEILILFLCDIVFLVLLAVCLPFALRISKNWDINAPTEKQYAMERQSYLVGTIIRFVLILKIPLFMLFIFANDKLSGAITGAMCAAGVINATVYGKYLLYFKILNIYLFGLWLVISHFDFKCEKLPYVKLKFTLFTPIFILFCIEIALFLLNFSLLDPTIPVSCCNVLFSGEQSVFLSIEGYKAFIIFGSSFAVMSILYFLKAYRAYGVLTILYFFTSVLSLIVFTSTYIYELPTHKCPFCILQSGYYFIGYLFYALLFIGTFSGLAALAIRFISGQDNKTLLRTSFVSNTLYFLLSVCYPLFYYLRNHTWL